MLRALLVAAFLTLMTTLPAANAGIDSVDQEDLATCGGILDANCQHVHSGTCGTGCTWTITYTCNPYVALGSNHPTGLLGCIHNI